MKQRVAKTKAQYEANCARFLKYSQLLDENKQVTLIDTEFSRLQNMLYREQKLQEDFRRRVCTADVDPINARVQFMTALKSFCNYQDKVMDKLNQRQVIQLREQKGNNEDERIFELKNKANLQVQNQIKLGES